ncbi:single-stranded DNA-binding protein [uncultured Alistipes sp.]|uniref:single-stranded DNA-binding protein n=1 Tax=uncultured Alistipes sp. TaxID=538949 RepID=UPI0028044D58|nr:single-stranded DNA-binding protein [uncultured Alistipes sp.]
MVNKVILIGNVGMDPEVRTVEGGAKVARVRLATTERLYDRQSGETKEHTEWHTITLWRGLADVVDRYVRKGSQIYVEGRLRTREWMDKDNNKRYTTEILADTMNLLGRRSDNPASDGPRQSGYQQGGYQQGGYQQSGAQQGGYQQPGGYQSAPQAGGYPGGMPGGAASGGYQQPQPAQQPAPQTPADDPDDLPF